MMRRSCSSSAALRRVALPLPSTLGGMTRPLPMAPARCLITSSCLHNSRPCLVGTAARRSYSSTAPPPSSTPPQDNKPQNDNNSEAPSSSTAEEAKDQSRPASDTPPTEPGTQQPPPTEQPSQQPEPINLFTAGTAHSSSENNILIIFIINNLYLFIAQLRVCPPGCEWPCCRSEGGAGPCSRRSRSTSC
jgi:hypothetical protein